MKKPFISVAFVALALGPQLRALPINEHATMDREQVDGPPSQQGGPKAFGNDPQQLIHTEGNEHHAGPGLHGADGGRRRRRRLDGMDASLYDHGKDLDLGSHPLILKESDHHGRQVLDSESNSEEINDVHRHQVVTSTKGSRQRIESADGVLAQGQRLVFGTHPLELDVAHHQHRGFDLAGHPLPTKDNGHDRGLSTSGQPLKPDDVDDDHVFDFDMAFKAQTDPHHDHDAAFDAMHSRHARVGLFRPDRRRLSGLDEGLRDHGEDDDFGAHPLDLDDLGDDDDGRSGVNLQQVDDVQQDGDEDDDDQDEQEQVGYDQDENDREGYGQDDYDQDGYEQDDDGDDDGDSTLGVEAQQVGDPQSDFNQGGQGGQTIGLDHQRLFEPHVGSMYGEVVKVGPWIEDDDWEDQETSEHFAEPYNDDWTLWMEIDRDGGGDLPVLSAELSKRLVKTLFKAVPKGKTDKDDEKKKKPYGFIRIVDFIKHHKGKPKIGGSSGGSFKPYEPDSKKQKTVAGSSKSSEPSDKPGAGPSASASHLPGPSRPGVGDMLDKLYAGSKKDKRTEAPEWLGLRDDDTLDHYPSDLTKRMIKLFGVVIKDKAEDKSKEVVDKLEASKGYSKPMLPDLNKAVRLVQGQKRGGKPPLYPQNKYKQQLKPNVGGLGSAFHPYTHPRTSTKLTLGSHGTAPKSETHLSSPDDQAAKSNSLPRAESILERMSTPPWSSRIDKRDFESSKMSSVIVKHKMNDVSASVDDPSGFDGSRLSADVPHRLSGTLKRRLLRKLLAAAWGKKDDDDDDKSNKPKKTANLLKTVGRTSGKPPLDPRQRWQRKLERLHQKHPDKKRKFKDFEAWMKSAGQRVPLQLPSGPPKKIAKVDSTSDLFHPGKSPALGNVPGHKKPKLDSGSGSSGSQSTGSGLPRLTLQQIADSWAWAHPKDKDKDKGKGKEKRSFRDIPTQIRLSSFNKRMLKQIAASIAKEAAEKGTSSSAQAAAALAQGGTPAASRPQPAEYVPVPKKARKPSGPQKGYKWKAGYKKPGPKIGSHHKPGSKTGGHKIGSKRLSHWKTPGQKKGSTLRPPWLRKKAGRKVDPSRSPSPTQPSDLLAHPSPANSPPPLLTPQEVLDSLSFTPRSEARSLDRRMLKKIFASVAEEAAQKGASSPSTVREAVDAAHESTSAVAQNKAPVTYVPVPKRPRKPGSGSAKGYMWKADHRKPGPKIGSHHKQGSRSGGHNKGQKRLEHYKKAGRKKGWRKPNLPDHADALSTAQHGSTPPLLTPQEVLDSLSFTPRSDKMDVGTSSERSIDDSDGSRSQYPSRSLDKRMLKDIAASVAKEAAQRETTSLQDAEMSVSDPSMRARPQPAVYTPVPKRPRKNARVVEPSIYNPVPKKSRKKWQLPHRKPGRKVGSTHQAGRGKPGPKLGSHKKGWSLRPTKDLDLDIGSSQPHAADSHPGSSVSPTHGSPPPLLTPQEVLDSLSFSPGQEKRAFESVHDSTHESADASRLAHEGLSLQRRMLKKIAASIAEEAMEKAASSSAQKVADSIPAQTPAWGRPAPVYVPVPKKTARGPKVGSKHKSTMDRPPPPPRPVRPPGAKSRGPVAGSKYRPRVKKTQRKHLPLRPLLPKPSSRQTATSSGAGPSQSHHHPVIPPPTAPLLTPEEVLASLATPANSPLRDKRAELSASSPASLTLTQLARRMLKQIAGSIAKEAAEQQASSNYKKILPSTLKPLLDATRIPTPHEVVRKPPPVYVPVPKKKTMRGGWHTGRRVWSKKEPGERGKPGPRKGSSRSADARKPGPPKGSGYGFQKGYIRPKEWKQHGPKPGSKNKPKVNPAVSPFRGKPRPKIWRKSGPQKGWKKLKAMEAHLTPQQVLDSLATTPPGSPTRSPARQHALLTPQQVLDSLRTPTPSPTRAKRAVSTRLSAGSGTDSRLEIRMLKETSGSIIKDKIQTDVESSLDEIADAVGEHVSGSSAGSLNHPPVEPKRKAGRPAGSKNRLGSLKPGRKPGQSNLGLKRPGPKKGAGYGLQPGYVRPKEWRPCGPKKGSKNSKPGLKSTHPWMLGKTRPRIWRKSGPQKGWKLKALQSHPAPQEEVEKVQDVSASPPGSPSETFMPSQEPPGSPTTGAFPLATRAVTFKNYRRAWQDLTDSTQQRDDLLRQVKLLKRIDEILLDLHNRTDDDDEDEEDSNHKRPKLIDFFAKEKEKEDSAAAQVPLAEKVAEYLTAKKNPFMPFASLHAPHVEPGQSSNAASNSAQGAPVPHLPANLGTGHLPMTWPLRSIGRPKGSKNPDGSLKPGPSKGRIPTAPAPGKKVGRPKGSKNRVGSKPGGYPVGFKRPKTWAKSGTKIGSKQADGTAKRGRKPGTKMPKNGKHAKPGPKLGSKMRKSSQSSGRRVPVAAKDDGAPHKSPEGSPPGPSRGHGGPPGSPSADASAIATRNNVEILKRLVALAQRNDEDEDDDDHEKHRNFIDFFAKEKEKIAALQAPVAEQVVKAVKEKTSAFRPYKPVHSPAAGPSSHTVSPAHGPPRFPFAVDDSKGATSKHLAESTLPHHEEDYVSQRKKPGPKLGTPKTGNFPAGSKRLGTWRKSGVAKGTKQTRGAKRGRKVGYRAPAGAPKSGRKSGVSPFRTKIPRPTSPGSPPEQPHGSHGQGKPPGSPSAGASAIATRRSSDDNARSKPLLVADEEVQNSLGRALEKRVLHLMARDDDDDDDSDSHHKRPKLIDFFAKEEGQPSNFIDFFAKDKERELRAKAKEEAKKAKEREKEEQKHIGDNFADFVKGKAKSAFSPFRRPRPTVLAESDQASTSAPHRPPGGKKVIPKSHRIANYIQKGDSLTPKKMGTVRKKMGRPFGSKDSAPRVRKLIGKPGPRKGSQRPSWAAKPGPKKGSTVARKQFGFVASKRPAPAAAIRHKEAKRPTKDKGKRPARPSRSPTPQWPPERTPSASPPRPSNRPPRSPSAGAAPIATRDDPMYEKRASLKPYKTLAEVLQHDPVPSDFKVFQTINPDEGTTSPEVASTSSSGPRQPMFAKIVDYIKKDSQKLPPIKPNPIRGPYGTRRPDVDSDRPVEASAESPGDQGTRPLARPSTPPPGGSLAPSATRSSDRLSTRPRPSEVANEQSAQSQDRPQRKQGGGIKFGSKRLPGSKSGFQKGYQRPAEWTKAGRKPGTRPRLGSAKPGPKAGFKRPSTAGKTGPKSGSKRKATAVRPQKWPKQTRLSQGVAPADSQSSRRLRSHARTQQSQATSVSPPRSPPRRLPTAQEILDSMRTPSTSSSRRKRNLLISALVNREGYAPSSSSDEETLRSAISKRGFQKILSAVDFITADKAKMASSAESAMAGQSSLPLLTPGEVLDSLATPAVSPTHSPLRGSADTASRSVRQRGRPRGRSGRESTVGAIEPATPTEESSETVPPKRKRVGPLKLGMPRPASWGRPGPAPGWGRGRKRLGTWKKTGPKIGTKHREGSKKTGPKVGSKKRPGTKPDGPKLGSIRRPKDDGAGPSAGAAAAVTKRLEPLNEVTTRGLVKTAVEHVDSFVALMAPSAPAVQHVDSFAALMGSSTPAPAAPSSPAPASTSVPQSKPSDFRAPGLDNIWSGNWPASSTKYGRVPIMKKIVNYVGKETHGRPPQLWPQPPDKSPSAPPALKSGKKRGRPLGSKTKHGPEKDPLAPPAKKGRPVGSKSKAGVQKTGPKGPRLARPPMTDPKPKKSRGGRKPGTKNGPNTKKTGVPFGYKRKPESNASFKPGYQRPKEWAPPGPKKGTYKPKFSWPTGPRPAHWATPGPEKGYRRPTKQPPPELSAATGDSAVTKRGLVKVAEKVNSFAALMGSPEKVNSFAALMGSAVPDRSLEGTEIAGSSQSTQPQAAEADRSSTIEPPQAQSTVVPEPADGTINPEPLSGKPKRGGRPKGAKNKPKLDASLMSMIGAGSFGQEMNDRFLAMGMKPKRGRPKGGKNKPGHQAGVKPGFHRKPTWAKSGRPAGSEVPEGVKKTMFKPGYLRPKEWARPGPKKGTKFKERRPDAMKPGPKTHIRKPGAKKPGPKPKPKLQPEGRLSPGSSGESPGNPSPRPPGSPSAGAAIATRQLTDRNAVLHELSSRGIIKKPTDLTDMKIDWSQTAFSEPTAEMIWGEPDYTPKPDGPHQPMFRKITDYIGREAKHHALEDPDEAAKISNEATKVSDPVERPRTSRGIPKYFNQGRIKGFKPSPGSKKPGPKKGVPRPPGAKKPGPQKGANVGWHRPEHWAKGGRKPGGKNRPKVTKVLQPKPSKPAADGTVPSPESPVRAKPGPRKGFKRPKTWNRTGPKKGSKHPRKTPASAKLPTSEPLEASSDPPGEAAAGLHQRELIRKIDEVVSMTGRDRSEAGRKPKQHKSPLHEDLPGIIERMAIIEALESEERGLKKALQRVNTLEELMRPSKPEDSPQEELRPPHLDLPRPVDDNPQSSTFAGHQWPVLESSTDHVFQDAIDAVSDKPKKSVGRPLGFRPGPNAQKAGPKIGTTLGRKRPETWKKPGRKPKRPRTDDGETVEQGASSSTTVKSKPGPKKGSHHRPGAQKVGRKTGWKPPAGSKKTGMPTGYKRPSSWAKPGTKTGTKLPPGSKIGFQKGPRPAHWAKAGRKPKKASPPSEDDPSHDSPASEHHSSPVSERMAILEAMESSERGLKKALKHVESFKELMTPSAADDDSILDHEIMPSLPSTAPHVPLPHPGSSSSHAVPQSQIDHVVDHIEEELQDLAHQTSVLIRPKGRPRGSKNQPGAKKSPGRPRGSMNQPGARKPGRPGGTYPGYGFKKGSKRPQHWKKGGPKSGSKKPPPGYDPSEPDAGSSAISKRDDAHHFQKRGLEEVIEKASGLKRLGEETSEAAASAFKRPKVAQKVLSFTDFVRTELPKTVPVHSSGSQSRPVQTAVSQAALSTSDTVEPQKKGKAVAVVAKPKRGKGRPPGVKNKPGHKAGRKVGFKIPDHFNRPGAKLGSHHRADAKRPGRKKGTMSWYESHLAFPIGQRPENWKKCGRKPKCPQSDGSGPSELSSTDPSATPSGASSPGDKRMTLYGDVDDEIARRGFGNILKIMRLIKKKQAESAFSQPNLSELDEVSGALSSSKGPRIPLIKKITSMRKSDPKVKAAAPKDKGGRRWGSKNKIGAGKPGPKKGSKRPEGSKKPGFPSGLGPRPGWWAKGGRKPKPKDDDSDPSAGASAVTKRSSHQRMAKRGLVKMAQKVDNFFDLMTPGSSDAAPSAPKEGDLHHPTMSQPGPSGGSPSHPTLDQLNEHIRQEMSGTSGVKSSRGRGRPKGSKNKNGNPNPGGRPRGKKSKPGSKQTGLAAGFQRPAEWGKPGRKPGWKPPPGCKSGFKKGVPRPAHWKKSGRKTGQKSGPDAKKPGPKPGVYVGPNRPPHCKKAGRKSRAEQIKDSETPNHSPEPNHGSSERPSEPRPLVVSTWPVPASVNHGESSFVERGFTEGVQKVFTLEDLMSPGPVANVVQSAAETIRPVPSEPSSSTAVPNEVAEPLGNESTEPVGQSALVESPAAQPKCGKGRPKGTKNPEGSKEPGPRVGWMRPIGAKKTGRRPGFKHGPDSKAGFKAGRPRPGHWRKPGPQKGSKKQKKTEKPPEVNPPPQYEPRTTQESTKALSKRGHVKGPNEFPELTGIDWTATAFNPPPLKWISDGKPEPYKPSSDGSRQPMLKKIIDYTVEESKKRPVPEHDPNQKLPVLFEPPTKKRKGPKPGYKRPEGQKKTGPKPGSKRKADALKPGPRVGWQRPEGAKKPGPPIGWQRPVGAAKPGRKKGQSRANRVDGQSSANQVDETPKKKLGRPKGTKNQPNHRAGGKQFTGDHRPAHWKKAGAKAGYQRKVKPKETVEQNDPLPSEEASTTASLQEGATGRQRRGLIGAVQKVESFAELMAPGKPGVGQTSLNLLFPPSVGAGPSAAPSPMATTVAGSEFDLNVAAPKRKGRPRGSKNQPNHRAGGKMWDGPVRPAHWRPPGSQPGFKRKKEWKKPGKKPGTPRKPNKPDSKKPGRKPKGWRPGDDSGPAAASGGATVSKHLIEDLAAHLHRRGLVKGAVEKVLSFEALMAPSTRPKEVADASAPSVQDLLDAAVHEQGASSQPLSQNVVSNVEPDTDKQPLENQPVKKKKSGHKLGWKPPPGAKKSGPKPGWRPGPNAKKSGPKVGSKRPEGAKKPGPKKGTPRPPGARKGGRKPGFTPGPNEGFKTGYIRPAEWAKAGRKPGNRLEPGYRKPGPVTGSKRLPSWQRKPSAKKQKIDHGAATAHGQGSSVEPSQDVSGFALPSGVPMNNMNDQGAATNVQRRGVVNVATKVLSFDDLMAPSEPSKETPSTATSARLASHQSGTSSQPVLNRIASVVGNVLNKQSQVEVQPSETALKSKKRRKPASDGVDKKKPGPEPGSEAARRAGRKAGTRPPAGSKRPGPALGSKRQPWWKIAGRQSRAKPQQIDHAVPTQDSSTQPPRQPAQDVPATGRPSVVPTSDHIAKESDTRPMQLHTDLPASHAPEGPADDPKGPAKAKKTRKPRGPGAKKSTGRPVGTKNRPGTKRPGPAPGTPRHANSNKGGHKKGDVLPSHVGFQKGYKRPAEWGPPAGRQKGFHRKPEWKKPTGRPKKQKTGDTASLPPGSPGSVFMPLAEPPRSPTTGAVQRKPERKKSTGRPRKKKQKTDVEPPASPGTPSSVFMPLQEPPRSPTTGAAAFINTRAADKQKRGIVKAATKVLSFAELMAPSEPEAPGDPVSQPNSGTSTTPEPASTAVGQSISHAESQAAPPQTAVGSSEPRPKPKRKSRSKKALAEAAQEGLKIKQKPGPKPGYKRPEGFKKTGPPKGRSRAAGTHKGGAKPGCTPSPGGFKPGYQRPADWKPAGRPKGHKRESHWKPSGRPPGHKRLPHWKLPGRQSKKQKMAGEAQSSTPAPSRPGSPAAPSAPSRPASPGSPLFVPMGEPPRSPTTGAAPFVPRGLTEAIEQTKGRVGKAVKKVDSFAALMAPEPKAIPSAFKPVGQDLIGKAPLIDGSSGQIRRPRWKQIVDYIDRGRPFSPSSGAATLSETHQLGPMGARFRPGYKRLPHWKKAGPKTGSGKRTQNALKALKAQKAQEEAASNPMESQRKAPGRQRGFKRLDTWKKSGPKAGGVPKVEAAKRLKPNEHLEEQHHQSKSAGTSLSKGDPPLDTAGQRDHHLHQRRGLIKALTKVATLEDLMAPSEPAKDTTSSPPKSPGTNAQSGSSQPERVATSSSRPQNPVLDSSADFLNKDKDEGFTPLAGVSAAPFRFKPGPRPWSLRRPDAKKPGPPKGYKRPLGAKKTGPKPGAPATGARRGRKPGTKLGPNEGFKKGYKRPAWWKKAGPAKGHKAGPNEKKRGRKPGYKPSTDAKKAGRKPAAWKQEVKDAPPSSPKSPSGLFMPLQAPPGSPTTGTLPPAKKHKTGAAATPPSSPGSPSNVFMPNMRHPPGSPTTGAFRISARANKAGFKRGLTKGVQRGETFAELMTPSKPPAIQGRGLVNTVVRVKTFDELMAPSEPKEPATASPSSQPQGSALPVLSHGGASSSSHAIQPTLENIMDHTRTGIQEHVGHLDSPIVPKRGRGRPKGSKNKNLPKAVLDPTRPAEPKGRGRPKGVRNQPGHRAGGSYATRPSSWKPPGPPKGYKRPDWWAKSGPKHGTTPKPGSKKRGRKPKVRPPSGAPVASTSGGHSPADGAGSSAQVGHVARRTQIDQEKETLSQKRGPLNAAKTFAEAMVPDEPSAFRLLEPPSLGSFLSLGQPASASPPRPQRQPMFRKIVDYIDAERKANPHPEPVLPAPQVEVGQGTVRKNRPGGGRPKGSLNKVGHHAGGRPFGSKNKPGHRAGGKQYPGGRPAHWKQAGTKSGFHRQARWKKSGPKVGSHNKSLRPDAKKPGRKPKPKPPPPSDDAGPSAGGTGPMVKRSWIGKDVW